VLDQTAIGLDAEHGDGFAAVAQEIETGLEREFSCYWLLKRKRKSSIVRL
jgi:hypothetical protein